MTNLAHDGSRPQKGEGFPGQRIVVLPRPVVARAQENPLLRGLAPTDAGYFPRARGHLRERPEGVDQAIFIYCARGAGWCELLERQHTVETGQLLVVPPGMPHAYGAAEPEPWSIHWFHVRGADVAPYMGALDVSAERPVVRIGEDAQLLALFEEALDTLEHGYTTFQLLYASRALSHLIAAMIRHHRGNPLAQPTVQQKVAQTIDYMKQRLHQSLPLRALSGVAGLSRSQYTALFKQQTGYAPIDYFIRLRMHRACQMLDTTAMSVKAVANALGYEDPLYFSRVFRSVNEISPTEYRQTRKG